MKQLVTTSIFLAFNLLLNAQSPIPYPVKQKAIDIVKQDKYLQKVLKEDYGVTDLSKIIIEAPYKENDAFDGYYSYEGKKRDWFWPYNMCYSTIYVTTPKNKDGSWYKIPVNVQFIRSVCDGSNCYLKNSWEYFNSQILSPEVFGKSAVSDELIISVFLKTMRDFEINYLKLKKEKPEEYANNLKNEVLNQMNISGGVYDLDEVVRIDSIWADKPTIKDPKKQSWVVRFRGLGASFEDQGSTMTHTGNNGGGVVNLEVELISGNWVVKDFQVRSGHGNVEEYKGDDLFASIEEVGFTALYKQTQSKKVPIRSEKGTLNFANALKKTIENLTFNEEKDIEMLSVFFLPKNNPKEQAKKLFNQFLEAKNKLVDVKKIAASSKYWKNSSEEVASISVSINFERLNAYNNKELAQKYKAVGMSKATLTKKNGYSGSNSPQGGYGGYKFNLDLSSNLIEENGRWYLNDNFVLHNEEIAF